jgi:hypothetical protein
VALTRWLTSHPLTQYVNIPILDIPSARILECPESASVLISSSEGPVACAGEQNNVRYAIFGFEIFPFDGIKTPTLSVLTLNTLKWLFQDNALANRPSPLGAINPPLGTESVHRLAPAEASIPPTSAATARVTVPGVLAFNGVNASRLGLRAFNFSSPTESNIRAENSITLNSPPEKKISVSDTTTKFWSYCAALALLVLVADVLRRIRSRSQWRAP